MKKLISLALFGLVGCGGPLEEGGTGESAEEVLQEARKSRVSACTLQIASVMPVQNQGYHQVTFSGTGFSPNTAVNFVLNGVATFTVSDASGLATSLWTVRDNVLQTLYAKVLSGRAYETCGSLSFTINSDGTY